MSKNNKELENDIKLLMKKSQRFLEEIKNEEKIEKQNNYFQSYLMNEFKNQEFGLIDISSILRNLLKEEEFKLELESILEKIENIIKTNSIFLKESPDLKLLMDKISLYLSVSEENKINFKKIFNYLEKREKENTIKINKALFHLDDKINFLKSENRNLRKELNNLKNKELDFPQKFKNKITILKKIINHKENCIKRNYQKNFEKKNYNLIQEFKNSEEVNNMKEMILNISHKNKDFKRKNETNMNFFNDMLKINDLNILHEKINEAKNLNPNFINHNEIKSDQYSMSSDTKNDNSLDVLQKSIFTKSTLLNEKEQNILKYKKQLEILENQLFNLQKKHQKISILESEGKNSQLKDEIENTVKNIKFIENEYNLEKKGIQILQSELIKIYYFNEEKKNHLITFIKLQKPLLYKRNKNLRKFFYEMKLNFCFNFKVEKLKRLVKRFNQIQFINNNIKKRYFSNTPENRESKSKEKNIQKTKVSKIRKKKSSLLMPEFNEKQFQLKNEIKNNKVFFDTLIENENESFEQLDNSISSINKLKSLSDDLLQDLLKNEKKLNINHNTLLSQEKILEFSNIINLTKGILLQQKIDQKKKFSLIQQFFKDNSKTSKNITQILKHNKIFREILNQQTNEINSKNKNICRLNIEVKKFAEKKNFQVNNSDISDYSDYINKSKNSIVRNSLHNKFQFGHEFLVLNQEKIIHKKRSFEKNYLLNFKKQPNHLIINKFEIFQRKLERIETYMKIRVDNYVEMLKKLKIKIKKIFPNLMFLKKIKDSVFFNFQIREDCQNFDEFYDLFKEKLSFFKSEISPSKKELFSNEISNQKDQIYELKQQNKNYDMFIFSLRMIFNKSEILILEKDPLEVIGEKINRYFSKASKLKNVIENKNSVILELKSQINELSDDLDETNMIKNELEQSILKIKLKEKNNFKLFQNEKNGLISKLINYEKMLHNSKYHNLNSDDKTDKEKLILTHQKILQEKDSQITKLQLDITKMKLQISKKSSLYSEKNKQDFDQPHKEVNKESRTKRHKINESPSPEKSSNFFKDEEEKHNYQNKKKMQKSFSNKFNKSKFALKMEEIKEKNEDMDEESIDGLLSPVEDKNEMHHHLYQKKYVENEEVVSDKKIPYTHHKIKLDDLQFFENNKK